MVGQTQGDRISKLEELVGDLQSPDGATLSDQMASMKADMDHLRKLLESHLVEAEERVSQLEAAATDWENKAQELQEEVIVLRRAVAAGGNGKDEIHRKLKVPSPKEFEGSRDAKALENFLWDVEQYFKAAHVQPEEKVTVASMYLSGDAKLWWRTRMVDDKEAGRPGIQTWDVLKKELKDQFLPNNASWIARENLRHLRQTSTVREYVKKFTSLLLDIRDMAEADKLFNFVSGLKADAQAELRRRDVKDLTTAIAVADSLGDYKVDDSSSEDSDKSLTEKKRVRKEKRRNRERAEGSQGKLEKNGKSNDAKGCFICGGPHFKRECPKRKDKEKVNALVVNDGPREEVRLTPLRLINAMQVTDNDKECAGTANQGMDGAKPYLKALMRKGSPRKGLAKGEGERPPSESSSGPGKGPRIGQH